MIAEKKVLIIGGGPSGLAAALLFSKLGCKDIKVVEKKKSAKDFEKNKAFTYQIDGRGQKLLKRLGLMDKLDQNGVANKSFHATAVTPDGKHKKIVSPIIDKDRVTCFWTTRRNLQSMLYEAASDASQSNIKLLYEHRISDVEVGSNGEIDVLIKHANSKIRRFTPDILLACDGLNSTTRNAISQLPDVPSDHFVMHEYPSPSAKLMYKVLNLPPAFTIRGKENASDEIQVNDNRMAYIFSATYKHRTKAMALFGFPVADSTHPRCVNIIREPDHHLWTIQSPQALLDFFTEGLPQLNISELVSIQEATDFVNLKPGKFPAPQHASALYAISGSTHRPMHCVLIGDAAHAFPPDLGLGVNSALEDLYHLEQNISVENDNLETAFRRYENSRLTETKALVKLVQTVFPYQYNQSPWRMKTWILRFMVQRALHKLLPKLISKPAFLDVQDHRRSYSQILRDKIRTDRVIVIMALLPFLLILFLIR